MPDAAVSGASSVQPTGGISTIILGLSNPEHETELITLASAIAKQRDATVEAVHIITVPDQTPLRYATEHMDELESQYHSILDSAKRDAEMFGVDLDTHTTVSHRSFGGDLRRRALALAA